MAKLPRTTQKIFGKNAPENQITTFGSIKAGTPVYTQSASQIMNSAFEGGWSEAVEDDYAPYRQDRNAVDTALTQQLAYLFQEGIPEWDAGTTYYKGSVVKVVNGNALTFYKSIADNNTSSVNTTAKWHKMLEINASNQIVSPSINTPTISGGSMSNGTFSNPTFSGTVNVPLASQSSSTDSTIAASIGWVNNPSLSSNVVHKTGDESINGTKTFTSSLAIKNNVDESLGTEQEKDWLILRESNNTNAGFIRQYWSTTQNQLRIRTLARHGEAAGAWGDIQQIIDDNGNYRVNIDCAGTLTNMALKSPTGSSTATDVPTKGWVNNPATSLNVVHRTGNETIAGNKTFTGYIKGQAGNDTNHAIKLGSVGVNHMDFYEYGGIWNFYKSDSGTDTLVAKIAELTTSTNDETLATTAYVKAQGYASDSDVVKTSGNQTIAGSKTFTSVINQTNTNPSFRQNNTNITKGTAPSSNFTGYPTVYRDTNGANLSWSTYAVSTDNLSSTMFHTAKAKTGTFAEAFLEVRYSAADGQYGLYFKASNTESGDKNTSLTKSTTSTTDTTIPCMGWVISKIETNLSVNMSNRVTVSESTLTSGYTAPSNGFIYVTGANTSNSVISFLIDNSYVGYNGYQNTPLTQCNTFYLSKGNMFKISRAFSSSFNAYFVPLG